jgi:Domain of unknown function (DUF4214)
MGKGRGAWAGEGSPVAGQALARASCKKKVSMLLALGAAVLATSWAGPAVAAPDMPAPSYANTLYVFLYDAPITTDATYAASRDALLARVTPGPYARVGFTTYYPVDLPWKADLANPVLSSPSRSYIEGILQRLQRDGLVYHVSAMLGMSRFFGMYEDAKREDRRNAQWFLDNLIAPPGLTAAQTAREAWVTPSRYARKLRRHMEAKTRAFAKRFLELQSAYPDTLISASGDAEAELSEARVDDHLPYNAQMIADYSPFTVLEFRDWLLHTGLYADGGPYGGQGYKKRRREDFEQGAGALTPENLARFNATFGTAFTSWRLEYFDWSLDDPIDGDKQRLKFRRYRKATFEPLPTSGGKYVGGGFDAPRAALDPSKKWWKLWHKFRQKMVANFARDVATWMTQPVAGEPTLAPDRWYTHQIPGDYLFGREKGGPKPHLRLETSASALSTSFVPSSLGSTGVTALDRFELGTFGPAGGYNRTSQYLFDAVEAKGLANWGILEYAPSWHIDVGPDTNVPRMKAQWHRAYGAGSHMFGYTPWPHFTDTANGIALGAFVGEVADAPRAPSYVPASLEQFVAQLFGDLLRRSPSGGESNGHVAAIADGTVPRPKLVADLIASSEAGRTVAAVTRFYLGLLGRAPDLGGLLSWMDVLLAGSCNTFCLDARRQTIVDAMSTTAEYRTRFGGATPTAQTFVTKLFQQLLGRTPSAGERDPWVNEILLGHLTMPQVARQFVESPEYASLSDRDTAVILTYLATLGTMPSNPERTQWRGRLAAGLSKRGMAQAFLVSPEYRDRFGG